MNSLIIKKNKYIKKKKINNTTYIKKNDVVEIKFLNIFLKKFRIKSITGICKKIKKKNTIFLNTKIKNEKIEYLIFKKSPYVLKINKLGE